jgi:uncharacterized protein with HEPN domain
VSSKNTATKIINALALARHNIALIHQWAGKADYKTLSADVMRCYGIQYAFISIAEAVKDIPEPTLKIYGPQAYWRDIIDFRNHLAHTYEDQLDHRIMDTIHSDIPELDLVLQKMLTELGAQQS